MTATAPKKAIGRTVAVKVSAVRELCEFTLARYERHRSECSDVMKHLSVYQECRGEFLAMEKLFIADAEVIELVSGYIDRIRRLFLGEFHPAASSECPSSSGAVSVSECPPASSGPKALSPRVLERGAAQEVA